MDAVGQQGSRRLTARSGGWRIILVRWPSGGRAREFGGEKLGRGGAPLAVLVHGLAASSLTWWRGGGDTDLPHKYGPRKAKSQCGECREKHEYRCLTQKNTDLPHKRTCLHRRLRVPGSCQRYIQLAEKILQIHNFAAGTSVSAHCKELTLVNTDPRHKQYRSSTQALPICDASNTDPRHKQYRSSTQALPICGASNTDPRHKLAV